MFGTALLMGSSYPFAKDVLAVMSPLLYSASRYLVAGLFLFAMLALMRRPIGAAAARLGADDPAVADRRRPVPGLLGPRHGADRAQRRLDRHDHDDGLLGHPRLVRRPAAAGAGLGRHRHRLRGRRAGGEQFASRRSRSPSAASTARCSGCSSAFAWALYVDRCAPYNLRLGALRVMAWTTLIGSLVLLPISLAFDSLGGVRPARRPAAGLLALHRASSPSAWPSWASAPASTGWG